MTPPNRHRGAPGMTPLIGVSSSSLPHASAQELLRGALGIDARCIDLRAGRGQAWEPQLELIADSFPVAFVGAGATLGAGIPAAPLPAHLMRIIVDRGIVLRLFVGPLGDAAAARAFTADVVRLRGIWGPRLRLAVEVHDAAPSLAALDAALTQHSIGAVVDTLGFARLHTPLTEAREFAHRHAIAVQVKGLVRGDGCFRHVALGAVPSLTAWTAALVRDARVPVTVETRAGSAADDISTLRQAIARGEGPRSAHAPVEVPSCVSAY